MGETKTQKLIKLLANGRIKYTDAGKITGWDQLTRLIKSGAINKIKDINPDYSEGLKGQKPMCFYLELGKPTEMGATRYPPATKEGIKKAIRLLENNKYTVLPPN